MGPVLLRLGPTATILAMIGYCAWTDDATTSVPTGNAAPLPQLKTELLNPQLTPPLARDPFNLNQVREQSKLRAVKETKKSNPKVVAASEKKPVQRLTGLILSGTSLGGQRLAVINNRVYSEGERLRMKDRSVWVVAQVMPGKVRLSNGEAIAELHFAERGKGPQGKPTTAAKAGPGTAQRDTTNQGRNHADSK